MNTSVNADRAQAGLTKAARRFARIPDSRNITSARACALRRLVDAARVFAVKSDEEWAAEVIAARETREKT